MVKKCSSILGGLMIMGMLIIGKVSIPDQTSTYYVNDYADVIDSKTSQDIVELNQKLNEQTGGCVVLTTVNFTNGSIEDYAYTMFNEWKLGDAKNNNGILVLFVIGDEDYYIMEGRGLESTLPESDIQSLVDKYLEDDFANKDYNSAALSITTQLANAIYNTNITSSTSSNLFSFNIDFDMIFIAVIILIFIFAVIASTSTRRSYTSRNYGPRPPRYRRYGPMTGPRPHHHEPPRHHDSFPGGPFGGGSFGGGSFGGGSSHHTPSGGGSSRGAGVGRRH